MDGFKDSTRMKYMNDRELVEESRCGVNCATTFNGSRAWRG
jgi:hypothetical protein